MLKRRFYIALLLALSLAYFSVGTYRNWPYKIESDGKYYYHYLVSAFFDGDLDFTNNYSTQAPEWMAFPLDHYSNYKNVNPITGRPANVFTVGPAVLWSPFMALAYGLGRLVNAISPDTIDLNPWGLYLQYGVMWAAVLYAVLALRGIEAILRRLQPNFSSSAIRWAQCLTLFASPMLYYVLFEVALSHIYDLFTLTVYLVLWLSILAQMHMPAQPRWRFAALGLFGGLQILVRTQNVLLVAVLSAVLALELWRQARQAEQALHSLALSLGVYAATLIIAASPWPLVNLYLYANPFYISQGEGFIDLASANVLGVLLSTRNGLFSHHPVLLIGLLGSLHFAWQRRHDRLARLGCFALLFTFAIHTYLNAAVLDWWGGHAFGQRRLLSCLPLFALGLAHIADAVLRRGVAWGRWLLAPLGAALCGLGVLLMAVHVLWWDYDQPHNIARWLFQYAPAKIANNLARPWDTYIPIANPFSVGYPVRLSGGEPYQEASAPVLAPLQTGKSYVIDIDYATTGRSKPVLLITYKPKNAPPAQADSVLLNETLRFQTNYAQRRLFFTVHTEVQNPILRLQNWASTGVWGIQKMALYERIPYYPDPPPPVPPTWFLFKN